MKNALRYLILFLLTLSVLAFAAACGDKGGETPSSEPSEQTEDKAPETKKTETEPSTDGPSETEKEVEKVDPSKYVKFVEFELPDDFRKTAVDHMRKESQVEWRVTETFHIKEQFEYWGVDMTYEKGWEMRGLPYGHTYMPMLEFERYLDENRGYTVKTSTWNDVAGVECASGLLMGLEQFSRINGGTGNFYVADKSCYALPLGDYEYSEGDSSLDICNKNGKDKMFECYKLAQAGDVLYHGPNSQHVRLVTECHVETKPSGELNPRRSGLYVIEQTNKIEKNKDGTYSTWRVDKFYTFDELFENGFIITTLSDYSSPEKAQKPYIGLTMEILPEDLAIGGLGGFVESGNTIHYVYAEVYNKSGELVKRNVMNAKWEGTRVDLRKLSDAVNGFAAGDYTFVLTAGIAAGEAELARVDFTKK